MPEESSEDELPPQIHKVRVMAVAEGGKVYSDARLGCWQLVSVGATLSLSCRYSLVDWGSHGACRLGATWAARCGISLFLLS